jgi:hypothetical protein
MDSILSQWFQSLTKYDDGNPITQTATNYT